ncbi:outer membrane protein assembly factor BamA [Novispirillum sp. DQ9]|uniref:outer membrane protein assembly factor BamA n=1 Tax=Novispirillum sp. DQ9 TaxID=3398612 RepID=UPI003C7E096C
MSVRPKSAAAVCVATVLSCAVAAAPASAQFVSGGQPEAQPGGGAFGGFGQQQPSGNVVREIAVEGNQRIEPATVRAYMVLKEGDEFDPARIDSSLKSLFATGLFADVSIGRRGDVLVVRVVENPIINRIAFEGNKRIDDKVLESEVQLRARQVYTRAKVQEDVSRVLDVYRRSGRYAVTVEPKIIELEQNRVDLAFEINEGPPTYIRRINFVGNEKFSDGRLREEIASREERWYRFFSSVDTYDPDRLTFDRELLRRHYLRQGYSDFRVVSAVAELTSDRSGFYVTFTVDEGERYTFGDTDVQVALPDVDAESLRPLVTFQPGDWYNADEVENTVQAITDRLGEMGYAFVDVRPRVNRDRDNRTIGITFDVQEGPRVYVERIDITGNVRTLDRVVRREFRLVEGDAFNTAKLRRSQQRIRNLGFFEDVKVTNVPSETAPDRTVVQVELQEKSTGELTFGVGWSSSIGALFDISMRERNLLGKGQDLRAKFTVAQRRQEVDLSFTEPYFLDRPLAAGVDLFHTRTDLQDESSYDSRETGGALRLGYNYTDRLTQGLKYTVSRTSIENVPTTASQAIKDQAGETILSMFSQSLTYDRRDSTIDPREGYFGRVSTDLAGAGGDERFVRATVDGGQYFPITDDVTLALQASAGIVEGVGKDVRFNRNYYLGGDNLRGFEFGGASPRDAATSDVLGGKWMAAGTVEVRFPLGLPEELGLTGKAFSDFGVIGEPDGTSKYNINTSSAPRASAGVGLVWVSPMGPVSIDLAQALLKEDWDETEFFRFNFGTRF